MKKIGIQPIPMMDRDKKDEVPQGQVRPAHLLMCLTLNNFKVIIYFFPSDGKLFQKNMVRAIICWTHAVFVVLPLHDTAVDFKQSKQRGSETKAFSFNSRGFTIFFNNGLGIRAIFFTQSPKVYDQEKL